MLAAERNVYLYSTASETSYTVSMWVGHRVRDSLDATIEHAPGIGRMCLRLLTCPHRHGVPVNSLLPPLPLICMSKLLNSESIGKWT